MFCSVSVEGENTSCSQVHYSAGLPETGREASNTSIKAGCGLCIAITCPSSNVSPTSAKRCPGLDTESLRLVRPRKQATHFFCSSLDEAPKRCLSSCASVTIKPGCNSREPRSSKRPAAHRKESEARDHALSSAAFERSGSRFMSQYLLCGRAPENDPSSTRAPVRSMPNDREVRLLLCPSVETVKPKTLPRTSESVGREHIYHCIHVYHFICALARARASHRPLRRCGTCGTTTLSRPCLAPTVCQSGLGLPPWSPPRSPFRAHRSRLAGFSDAEA
jgi:hypothetical protein